VGGDFGVVPLGLPLIVGPATLTTLLILLDTVGLGFTLAALLVNLLLVVVALRYSERLAGWVGMNGLRAISKIVALLLVAIAIHMIRLGLQAG
jgi:multiple antibiotic resistance protein